ncbi:MAG: electron transfer flavoprotein subunit beta/FixA family protein, partial [Nitrospinales bacterium]
VCVKQVLDTDMGFNIKDGQVDSEGIAPMMSTYDEIAVEEAIRIKESRPGTEITVMTLGPENSRDVLQRGLEMGADQAVHLMDSAFTDLDHYGISRALAKAVQDIPYDLILCGQQSVDEVMAHVGPALAVFLNIPCISFVTQLTLSENGKQAEITRQTDEGSEILDTSLPLLITCHKKLNLPRFPNLKGVMEAKKKEVKVLDATAIGFDPDSMGSQTNRVRLVDLSLPPQREKCLVLDGYDDETVSKLVKILRHEKKIV